MKLLGLTGGVGMGKSTCADLLRARHVPVLDTDDLAREVVEPGQPALDEVRRIFGHEVIDAEGRLRRDILARRVFSDSEARKQLEGILHPRIRTLWRAQANAWRDQGRPLGVVAIPLLFETKAETELDAVICVACSPATQLERLTRLVSRTNRATHPRPIPRRRKDGPVKLCDLDRRLDRNPRRPT
jgi:dephospho-CoA kinase